MEDDDLHDLFAAFGPITIKRMFGGKGFYADGFILGVVVDGDVYLKGDAETSPAMEEAGGERWVYAKDGRKVNMPYWRVPASAMDDPEDMAVWARAALGASRRAEAAKARKAQPRKAPARKATSPKRAKA
jgi:DNA transformation protein and related proteins